MKKFKQKLIFSQKIIIVIGGGGVFDVKSPNIKTPLEVEGKLLTLGKLKINGGLSVSGVSVEPKLKTL